MWGLGGELHGDVALGGVGGESLTGTNPQMPGGIGPSAAAVPGLISPKLLLLLS